MAYMIAPKSMLTSKFIMRATQAYFKITQSNSAQDKYILWAPKATCYMITLQATWTQGNSILRQLRPKATWSQNNSLYIITQGNSITRLLRTQGNLLYQNNSDSNQFTYNSNPDNSIRRQLGTKSNSDPKYISPKKTCHARKFAIG